MAISSNMTMIIMTMINTEILINEISLIIYMEKCISKAIEL